MSAQTQTKSSHLGLIVAVICAIAVWWLIAHRPPSKPPHTPRPPAGPTNVRPATNAPPR